MNHSPKSLIKQHEGLELKLYKCPAGKLTIGYGHNIEDNGITEDMAEFILDRDIEDAEDYLKQYFWYYDLDPNRRAALIDMMYNLGPQKFSGFHKMITAFAAGDHLTAADEAEDSLWYRQVGNRGKTIVRIIRTGE